MNKNLDRFTEWFVKNYPGPNTIICSTTWHAPKIYRAAVYELEQENKELRKVAARYAWLKEQAGYVEDGSCQTVKFFQDDATRSWHIKAGNASYGCDDCSLDAAIDAAMVEK